MFLEKAKKQYQLEQWIKENSLLLKDDKKVRYSFVKEQDNTKLKVYDKLGILLSYEIYDSNKNLLERKIIKEK